MAVHSGFHKVADRIVALITGEDLQPGDRLPSERRMAVDFGVSRPTLREGIQALISQGRLVSRQGGGTYVASPDRLVAASNVLRPLSPLVHGDAGYWQDIMEIRKSLEGDAAACAALRANDDDKARLVAAFDRLALTAPDDTTGQARADAAFHMAVAQAAHNAVLYQMMLGLLDLLEASISDSLRRIYHVPGVLPRLDEQHRMILDAIVSGRPDRARAAANDHLCFVEQCLGDLETAAARRRRSSRAFGAITKEGASRP